MTADGGDESMDSGISKLTTRLGTAVGDVTPQTMLLVDAGLTAGRRQVRRRRNLVATVAAAVLLAGGGATYTGLATDLFGTHDVPPAGVDQAPELEPATPRGLAAALESLVAIGRPTAAYGQIVEPAGSGDGAESYSEPATMVMLEYQIRSWAGFVQASVSADQAGLAELCDEPEVTCHQRTAPNGQRALVARMRPEPGYGAPMDAVIVFGDDEAVMVSLTAWGSSGRGDRIGVDDLLRWATDPRISQLIDPAWNAVGETMAEFDEQASEEIFSDSTTSSDDGQSDSTTAGTTPSG